MIDIYIGKHATPKSLTELPSIEIWDSDNNPYHKTQSFPASELYEDKNVIVYYHSKMENKLFGLNNQIDFFVHCLNHEYFNYIMCITMDIKTAYQFDNWMKKKGILAIFGKEYYSSEVHYRTYMMDELYSMNCYK